MKGTCVVLASLLAVLFLAACVPAAAPVPAPVAPAPAASVSAPVAPALAPVAPAKEAWQQEWEKTIDEAKKEGVLIVYSGSGGEVRRPLLQALRTKYGINLEMLSGRGSEIMTKIRAERRAGIFATDVYIGGPNSPLTALKPIGALEPLDSALILPEVKDAKMWWNGGLSWIDKDHTLLATLIDIKETIAFNPNIVKPEEVRSFQSLLDPKWKGKLSLQDPSTAGTGGNWFANMILMGALDESYMRKLAAQQPFITRDMRLQVEWVAHGKYPVTIAPDTAAMADILAAGAPIVRLVPAEGTYVTSSSGTIAMLNKAPNLNAAKVLINWILTKEGQTALGKGLLCQSRRLDVPTDFLPPDRVTKPGVNYWDSQTEERLGKAPELQKGAKEIFDIK